MAVLLRRRSLLTAGLLSVLAACGSGTTGTPAPARPHPVDPDVSASQRVGATLRTLIARYDSLGGHPELRTLAATQLAVLEAGHPSARPRPSGSDTATPTPASAVRLTPGALGATELTLGAACDTEVLVTSPPMARLLASLSAGSAQRAVLLGERLPTEPSPLSGRLRPSTTELSALQAALGAEHATVYGYGVLGALLGGSRRAQATADYQLHRGRRDVLTSEIGQAGVVPQAAAPAYELPFSIVDAASARRLAGLLEERLAAVYANGVEAAENEFRAEAALQLRLAALRALTWRGTATAFPGLPDPSAR